MTEYRPQEIEKKWQAFWKQNQTFKTEFPSQKPKYYVLDMFPYPSGAGLHVGHPLGYIATDIVARYKRLKGYNVLHPMGYDSFGLPAEQYAVQTGQHPAVTTENNINRYREQMDNIGFSYDWSREVRTSDPTYYKWTQWIFIQLFNHWYNRISDKAEPIETLIAIFEKDGNKKYSAIGGGAACDADIEIFTADQWYKYSDKEKYAITLKYRLAYQSNSIVNWCPQLGTVLANEEVKDGVSERGGYPVIRKEMPQWSLRITAYADRLINDLDLVDWPDPIKEQQRNWIGKSKGCMLEFKIQNSDAKIEVFTTRVDTIYGVTYLTLAPEHELVDQITTPDQKENIAKYILYAKNKSERDRQADVKTVTGAFTGAYAINPLNGALIPIWIGEYVLAGYGTGAVMAVPSSDTRDYAFAKHFNLPIIAVQEGSHTDITKEDFDPKAGTMINSDFLNGMAVPQALEAMTRKVEELGVGYGKYNYKIRDAIFSRQRYWGEPIPVFYKDGMPYVLKESELPLELPKIDAYKPTETGEPPLARAEGWKYETSTMPGWAGSSWYFIRYMDNTNDKEFASKEAIDYWQEVDLYLGGSEHATGHLLYSRFWQKFLYDLGKVKTKEYAKKLINQGMISGVSQKILTVSGPIFDNDGSKKSIHETNTIYTGHNNEQVITIGDMTASVYYSYDYFSKIEDYISQNPDKNYRLIPVNINIVSNNDFNTGILDINEFLKDENYGKNKVLIVKNGYWKNSKFHLFKDEPISDPIPFLTKSEVEKMSKSKFNVVNPDDVINQYGADTLRLFEMFLGPLEMSKPWNTASISGVSRFLRNVWRLFYDDKGNWVVTEGNPDEKSLRILHKTIKKIEEDIERFSFNTSVSTFMVCVNELNDLKCHNKQVLSDLLILMTSYAPHITEELWSKLGNTKSIAYATFPTFNPDYLVENSYEYPISINGKLRHKMSFSLDTLPADVEKEVLASQEIVKWTEGKAPKKVIVVPGRIVNIVL